MVMWTLTCRLTLLNVTLNESLHGVIVTRKI